MAKTIEQLAEQANIIQTAIRQGENTAERVGGLFSDIVDYLSAYKGSDIKLGPLLSALNDPTLINPEDGQTISFSITKEGWKFDDALTELKVSDRRIEQLVSSNYQQFINTKNEFEQDMYDITEDLNQKYADFDSYRIQTDQYIDQWCVAYDEHGNKVSTSRIYQTAEEIQTEVTNNKEAADAAFDNINNVVIPGLDSRLDDVEEESGNSASWISQNKNKISVVVANFDDQGNPTAASGLVTTATYAGLFTAAMDENGVVTSGTISTYLTDFVTEEGVEGIISVAEIGADQIKFNLTFDWEVKNSDNQVIFKLNNLGDLEIAGTLKQCQLIEEMTVGEMTNKLFITPSGVNGAALVGKHGSSKVIDLGFDDADVSYFELIDGNNKFQAFPTGMTIKYGTTGIYNVCAGTSYTSWELGSSGTVTVGCNNNGKMIMRSTGGYPSESDVTAGYVYKDSNGFLKVKQS